MGHKVGIVMSGLYQHDEPFLSGRGGEVTGETVRLNVRSDYYVPADAQNQLCLVGWAGTCLILSAHILNEAKILTIDSAIYQIMNIVGALASR